jgi:hypothetical protein
MASSLDDMEAHELLQIELDRSLTNYLLSIPHEESSKAETAHLLNSWIEYICFQRHLFHWEEIISPATELSFWLWYEELAPELTLRKTTLIDILHRFQNNYS